MTDHDPRFDDWIDGRMASRDLERFELILNALLEPGSGYRN